MKKKIRLTLLLLALVTLGIAAKKNQAHQEKRVQLEMVTDKGTLAIELYNETPLHRDNFVKLVKEGFFDGILFHRVIKDFMAQAGDPESKGASKHKTLGEGEVPYKIDAEFSPSLFHKKGALGAARDGNPERASSGSQFYIVQGKVQNDSLLTVAEGRINNWLASYYATKDKANEALVTALQRASKNKDRELATKLGDSLTQMGKLNPKYTPYTIPAAHRAWYKTKGGTPHLDQNYTVFGEVVSGLSVIDSITRVPTSTSDRPVKDLRIISVKIVD